MAGGGATNEHGLTQKQEAFCQHFVECGNATEAYRRAYNIKKNPKDGWIHVEACQLLDNPKISLRLEGLREAASKVFFYGVGEAFKELEEARQSAKKNEAPAAMVSAVKGKMDLFGLGHKNVRLSGPEGEPLSDLSSEKQLDLLRLNLPVLIPMLNELGYDVVERDA